MEGLNTRAHTHVQFIQSGDSRSCTHERRRMERCRGSPKRTQNKWAEGFSVFVDVDALLYYYFRLPFCECASSNIYEYFWAIKIRYDYCYLWCIFRLASSSSFRCCDAVSTAHHTRTETSMFSTSSLLSFRTLQYGCDVIVCYFHSVFHSHPMRLLPPKCIFLLTMA